MAFRYNPKDAVQCFQPGEYEAAVESVKEKVSKAGNDMLEVVFKVFNGASEQLVWDYISNPKTLFKLKKIARAFGREQEFDAGEFNLEQHVGQVLTVELSIESDDFGDKNRVVAYKTLERKTGVPKDADTPF